MIEILGSHATALDNLIAAGQLASTTFFALSAARGRRASACFLAVQMLYVLVVALAVSGLAALNHAFFNVTGILLIAVNLVIAASGVIGDDWSASSSPARSRFGGVAGGWTIGMVGALWSYLVVYLPA